MSFIAVGGTLLAGGTIGAGTIAAGAGLAGAGLSLIGSNKQASANASANAANQAAQQKQNDASWTSWLMSRGVSPTPGAGSFTAGSTPGAGQYQATNTRLPLWATIDINSNPGQLRVVRKGSGTPPLAPTLTPTPIA